MVSQERLKQLISWDWRYEEIGHDVAAALRELLSRREQDRWIPVSEKLPKTYDYVAFFAAGTVESREGWFSDGIAPTWTATRTPSRAVPASEVTHWRPLPQPPTEKRDANS